MLYDSFFPSKTSEFLCNILLLHLIYRTIKLFKAVYYDCVKKRCNFSLSFEKIIEEFFVKFLGKNKKEIVRILMCISIKLQRNKSF